MDTPHPTVLTDAFDRAHSALQTLPGITTLPSAQREHEDMLGATEATASQFRSGRDEIPALPHDPVVIDELVAILDSHAERVQAELENATSGPTLAEDIAAGALQRSPTETYNAMLGARIFGSSALSIGHWLGHLWCGRVMVTGPQVSMTMGGTRRHEMTAAEADVARLVVAGVMEHELPSGSVAGRARPSPWRGSPPPR